MRIAEAFPPDTRNAMWTIRQATIDDIDTLVELRLRFLGEIGYGGDNVAGAVRDYMLQAIPAGQFAAWVAEEDSQIIATGGLVYCQKVPHGRNPSGREGFVLNMYTLTEWRGRGIATVLMETIVEHVRQQGITCIRLHASEDGMGIYTKLGFRADNSEMVLNLTG
jgi:GNAT superfamily N-acetyltransferase